MLKGGEGGGTKSSEVVLTQELEILAILKGGAKSIYPLKVSDPRFSHFVALLPARYIIEESYPHKLGGYKDHILSISTHARVLIFTHVIPLIYQCIL